MGFFQSLKTAFFPSKKRDQLLPTDRIVVYPVKTKWNGDSIPQEYNTIQDIINITSSESVSFWNFDNENFLEIDATYNNQSAPVIIIGTDSTGNSEVGTSISGESNQVGLYLSANGVNDDGMVINTSSDNSNRNSLTVIVGNNNMAIQNLPNETNIVALLLGRNPETNRLEWKNINEYVDDTAVDSDTTLPSGSLYKLVGSRNIYIKP